MSLTPQCLYSPALKPLNVGMYEVSGNQFKTFGIFQPSWQVPGSEKPSFTIVISIIPVFKANAACTVEQYLM